MRLILLCGLCLASTAALAQTPSSIEIIADQSQVVVGRTLQARAFVHDAAGKILPTAVTWSLNQPNAASISSTGLVTAKGLATVRLTARAGSVSAEAAIQCIPAKIEMTPGKLEVKVGTKTKFTATPYDADGNVIPNVAISWSLTNQRQGGSSLGVVDNAGMLTATGEGGLWVWATYFYNESFPGLQQRWVAYAPVSVVVPQTYELHKLYSTLEQTRSNWKLRARQTMLWTTDDGQLFFNASLSGLANGLLSWKDNTWKMVTAAGVPRFGRAATALDFRTHSITRDGQILSYEDTNINGAELNYGTIDGLQPFLTNNVPLGATEGAGSLFINRNSMAGSGQKIVRAAFQFPDETTRYTGLFRGKVAPDELLISTKEVLPAVASPFSIDSDFGIAADGTAFYSVTSGANRIFYKHDFVGRTKLLGVGDTVGTSKVRSFLGGRTNQPASWFDEDGTAIIAVLLEDNTQWYVALAPDGTTKTLRLTSQTGILWRSPSQGVLLYANPFGSQGNGVYLWQGATATPVYVLGRKLFDQTIQEIESGTIDADGRITLLLRGDSLTLMAARMGDTPHVLFGEGDAVEIDLPVNLFTLIGGAKIGPPHAQAGGNSGSISRFKNGDWETTLGIGKRLFGNTMWFGGSHGTTYNMRKAPNGDIYLITNAGIAKMTGDEDPQLVLPFPLRLDNNLTVNNPGQFDVNGNGDLLFASSTSAGDTRFFIWQNGQTKQILAYSTTLATATTIEGRIVSNFNSFALDSTGRVIAQLLFRGVTLASIGVWDGNTWTIAALPGSSKVGNHTVTNVPNIVRASGPHIVSGLIVDGIGTILAEWQGSSWKILVDITTVMPNGQVANSLSAADLNARGDLLFQFSNGVNSIVVLKGGSMRQVHNFFRPTPAGEFLLRINAMDLRDDGTVYFLAVNQFDEVVLYEAVPTGL